MANEWVDISVSEVAKQQGISEAVVCELTRLLQEQFQDRPLTPGQLKAAAKGVISASLPQPQKPGASG